MQKETDGVVITPGVASVVCFAVTDEEVEVLIVPIRSRRKREQKDATHTLPGGHIELRNGGKTLEYPAVAAMREFWEEAHRRVDETSLYPVETMEKQSHERPNTRFFHHFFMCLSDQVSFSKPPFWRKSRKTGDPEFVSVSDILTADPLVLRLPPSHVFAMTKAVVLCGQVLAGTITVRHPTLDLVREKARTHRHVYTTLQEIAVEAQKYLDMWT